ncbi:MAG: tRNA (guanosine(37)-N1)-methyltransferase TrmD [Chloroflexi bacterium AL-W]|nr:tRNA (guanosine(37)-N1)-methyltransferase TrmD [Chloroflexi bacterium AL-N1]NOK66955.1 tRNA (guanosine(37)-N1)-methyltransferase TrmD [Chloroflexi bacterium AL-N10]NOK74753.1 tRNA (guanosine(37)-N1)-methyltransferase TrmD [Chloroflexi bacterium AL-N5]NOK81557.1 tRNA (guanosine(37)-N1)-methyltransferase TrmD [Chloroflexi bacterium AL-W]NOK89027.1 tRNA (guanosine(37)-N1)-methyltransferase TrmD [Chloroflexi bacterium AL-N15]
MQFDILTLFPDMFTGPLTESIIKRAIQAQQICVNLYNIRDYATDRHRTTDDTPYGGGAGMVMKVAPLAAALRDVVKHPVTAASSDTPQTLTVLMSPAGEQFNQSIAGELARYDRLILICGRYEGIDERVHETFIERALSIGDYVITGGELAAMVVLDAVARLIPDVLDAESITEETFSDGLLEYPQYTRPAVWEGQAVPDILLSGHHGHVAQWRRQQRLLRTLAQRPDLLTRAVLSTSDRAFLKTLGWDRR